MAAGSIHLLDLVHVLVVHSSDTRFGYPQALEKR